MRRLLPWLVLGGCGEGRPCDARATVAALAGPAAVDCGSADPYRGRFDPSARDVSTACMLDAVDAGAPFFAAWLERCELETCAFEGRAFDGVDLWELRQWLLDGFDEVETDVLVRCVPEVFEQAVISSTGEVVVRSLRCGEVLEAGELDDDVCLEPPGFDGPGG